MRSPLSRRAGVAMRKLRLSKGWTLMKLSERSAIPVSTLSKLELGQLVLTYEKWSQICKALGVAPDEHVWRALEDDTVSVSGRRSVSRRGDAPRVSFGPYVAEIAATELVTRAFTPMIVELQASTLEEHGPLRRTPGEMFLYAIEGRVKVCSEHFAPLALDEGDGVFFDGASAHALLAVQPPARALLVMSGDGPFWP